MEDSMMSGNVNIQQQSSETSSAINLKDSAMSGDIVINQSNAQEISTGIVTAWKEIGLQGSSQENNNLSITQEVKELVKVTENLQKSGFQLDTDTLWNLYWSTRSMDINSEKTIQYSTQLIEMHTLNNEFYPLCKILRLSAADYNRIGETATHLQLITQALNLARRYEFKELEFECIIELANISENVSGLSLKAQQELIERATNLISDFISADPSQHQAILYTAHGNLLRDQGQYHAAIDVFEHLSQICDTPTQKAAGVLGIAGCYVAMNLIADARITFQKALDYCLINGVLGYAEFAKERLAYLEGF